MNSISNKEVAILSIEDDMCGLFLIARDEIEVIGFGQLIDRENIPERIVKTDD